jgi:hypothetical protein
MTPATILRWHRDTVRRRWARLSRLRSQVQGILALDFTADRLYGTKVLVLAVIQHGSRRVRVPGATEHPVQSWIVDKPGTCSWTWGMPGHKRSSSCMTGTLASRRRSVLCSRRPGYGHPPRRSGAVNESGYGAVGWQLPA